MVTENPLVQSGKVYNESVLCFILNWNGAQLTLNCIRSINNGSIVPSKIIVIDNGSSDDSLDILTRGLSFNCVLLETKKNLGYGGGLQFGLDHSQYQRFDLLWFLNNDTIIANDTLEKLILAYENIGPNFIFSPRILHSPNSRLEYYSGFWMDECTGHFTNHKRKKQESPNSGKWIRCDAIQGSSFLVPTPVVLRYGFFDPSYFLYWEEFDYSYYLRKHGVGSICVVSSLMYHQAEGSNTCSSFDLVPIRNYYRSRNKILFWKKYFSKLSACKYILKLVRKEFRASGPARNKRLIFLGIFHGILGIRGESIKILSV